MNRKKISIFATIFLLFSVVSVYSLQESSLESPVKIKVPDQDEPLAFMYGENGTVVYDASEVNLDNSLQTVLYTKEDGSMEVFSFGSEGKKVDMLLLNRTFLKEEGYLKDEKVPVIISLNLEPEEKSEEQKPQQLHQQPQLLQQQSGEEKIDFEVAKAEVDELLKEKEVEEESGIKSTESEGEIKKDLEIIDAVSAEIPLNKLKDLAESEAVEKIYLDRRVEVVLDESVPLINATRVWQMQNSTGHNITGKSVTIAIIDTGIDYTHPDLSGKYLGGYDFYNEDSDPMDDHGHGTHCAGIAASNGTLKGVAPDAKLYAYKVLSAGGYGSWSDVISGIERATDPNNDGDYSDHVDVISLSLGGYGDEDDAVSQAIDTAVSRGVVAAIAVGNSGPSSSTIMSPGAARQGIGVAAACKPSQAGSGYCYQGNMAYFSSRGPTGKYNLKPDLAAPGVLICSSQWDSAWSNNQCYDSKHVEISGTSMATPHVAGASALVLQYHSDWTPAMVKSALMSTARGLGFDVWTEGAGLIDLYRAVNTPIVTYPTSLSFGLVSESNITKQLVIRNLNSSSITVNITAGLVTESIGSTYNISYIVNSTDGSNITASNFSSIVLSPGNNTVNLTVNIGNLEGTFYGYINLTIGSEFYKIPYTFIRKAKLTVRVMDGKGNALYPWYIIVHNRTLTLTQYTYGWYLTNGSYSFNVPSGEYVVHVIGDYQNYSLMYILTGNTTVPVANHVEYTFNLSDARAFNLTAKNINNQSLDLYKWQFATMDKYDWRTFGTGVTYIGYFGFTGDRIIYLTNTENDTAFNISLSYIGFPSRNRTFNEYSYYWVSEGFETANETYLAGWILNNITNTTATILNFTASNFGLYNYSYNYPGADPHLNMIEPRYAYNAIIFWISPSTWGDASGWYSFAVPLNRTYYAANSYIKSGTTVATGDGTWGFWHYLHINYMTAAEFGGNWVNEFAAAVGQEEDTSSMVWNWPIGIRTTAGDSKNIYYGTTYLPTFFQNTGNLINVSQYLLKGYTNESYMYKSYAVYWWSSDGTSGVVYLPRPVVSIWNSVDSLIYNSTYDWSYFSYWTSAGVYTVNITMFSKYPLFNQTIITAKFDTSAADKNPPKLVQIHMVPRFEINNNLSVTLDVADDNAVSGVAAEYRTDASGWTSVPISNYKMNINITNSSATRLDLKIIMNDTSNNKINYTILSAALLAHNVSLNFTANGTSVNQGDTILFKGRVMDTSDNNKNLTGIKVVFLKDEGYYGHDENENYDIKWTYDSIRGWHRVYKGEFETVWTVPANQANGIVNFDAVFYGTGVYLPNTTRIQIVVNSTLAFYSNLIRYPSSPDVNDRIQFNSTWINARTVLFVSNHTGTSTAYNTTQYGSVFYYNISAGLLSAGAVVQYYFQANNTVGGITTTPAYTFTVQSISTNISAGQTLLSVDVNQSNTLWCEYMEVGSSDITGASVNASIDSSNYTMSYDSADGRYEYDYTVSGSTGIKTWDCFANKTNYTSQNVRSSFTIRSESTVPNYTNVARTADPIYTNTNVTLSTTWQNNVNLTVVIFSSNYTGAWANYTVTENANVATGLYNATFTILSHNFSSNQVIGWKYLASDSSSNWNNYMPVQTFTVQNRNPGINMSYNQTDRGWGETWMFRCNTTDDDGDTVNVSLWSKAPGGSWVLSDSTSFVASSSPTRGFTFGASKYFNRSYIGTSQIKCNVTDGKGGTNETTAVNVTVEKDDVSVNVTMGINGTVQRENTFNSTIVLGIRVYDSDNGSWVNEPDGKIYISKGGNNQTFDINEICTGYGNGSCIVSYNPADDSTIGTQYFFGGMLSTDPYYKAVNTTQSSFNVLGSLYAIPEGPSGSFNRSTIVYLNTTTKDDNREKVFVDTSDVKLEYKPSGVSDWRHCINVTELTEANYYCPIDTSNLTLGFYDIKYTAEKTNYTSISITHGFRFVITTITEFCQKFNFTANISNIINATNVNISIRIVPNASLSNAWTNVTFNSSNPTSVNFSVRELGKYIRINVSSELAGNLSFAIIKVNYTDAEVNSSGINETTLRLYKLNDSTWTPYNNQSIDFIGGVNTDDNYVWGNVTSFSDFGIGGESTGNQSCSSNSECGTSNCAEDYDGSGAWCAPAGNCAHDYDTSYTHGTNVCYGSYKETCNSGSWSATYCSYTCSNGACGSAPGGGTGGTVGGALNVPEKTTTTTIKPTTTTISATTTPTCIQLITYATNPTTNECLEFKTPCDVPKGWIKVERCQLIKPIPIPKVSLNIILGIFIAIMLIALVLFYISRKNIEKKIEYKVVKKKTKRSGD